MDKEKTQMLYAMHEMSVNAARPLRCANFAGIMTVGNPLSLFPFSSTRLPLASMTLFERLTRIYSKPSFNITSTVSGGREIAVRPEVVARKPFCDVIHFSKETSAPGPKVLVVAPMSGHYATLLRGTVEGLLTEHDVYITDWRNAREVPLGEGDFGLDDYVTYLTEFFETLAPDLHVMAVCQPTVPTTIATAHLSAAGSQAAPRSLILMGGPIDTRAAPTAVTQFAVEHPLSWFHDNLIDKVPHRFAGSGREVYPGFLQLVAFMSMQPSRHFKAHWDFFKHLVRGDQESAAKTAEFYDEYLAVSDLPAAFYLETVQRVFQEQLLARNLYRYRDQPVNLAAIDRTGVMTVEGALDDISAPGQTHAIHALCPNIPSDRRAHHLQAEVGHYGIFNGRRYRTQIVPHIARFIRLNETKNYPGLRPAQAK